MGTFSFCSLQHLVEELSSRHRGELQSVHQSNQIAVMALKEQMEEQNREELRQAAERHSEDIGKLFRMPPPVRNHTSSM